MARTPKPTMPTRPRLDGAREHARAQAGATAVTQRTMPATDAVDLPDGVDAADVIWDETVGAGGYAVARAAPRRGAAAHRPRRRRLRAPARATTPRRPGRAAQRRRHRQGAVAGLPRPGARAAVGHGSGADDDRRRHQRPATTRCAARQPDGGNARATARAASTRATPSGARPARASPRPSTGSTAATSPTGVNLFKSVRVDDDGSLHLGGEPRPGAAVELRAELDVIVVVANVPHPLDDRPDVHRLGRALHGVAPLRPDRRARSARPRPSASGPSRTPTTSSPGRSHR